MYRATEKGLMITFIGFFTQVFLQLWVLKDLSLICCLSAPELLVLVGIILIFMGRFEFHEKHRKIASYSIIIFIVLHVGILVLGFQNLGTEVLNAVGGVKMALIFLINFMLVYHIVKPSGRMMLSLALVLGVVAAGVLSYYSLPLAKDDVEINEELEELMDEDELAEKLASLVSAEDEFEDEIEELQLNVTACYSNITAHYQNWTFGDENLTINTPDLVIFTLDEVRQKIQDNIGSLDETLNLTLDLENLITVNEEWIIINNGEIDNKTRSKELFKDVLDNLKLRNKYNLVTVIPTLLFGLIYVQTYGMVKRDFNKLEESQRREKELELEGMDEEEDGEEEEEDEDEEDSEEAEEIESPKEKTRRKPKKNGKRTGKTKEKARTRSGGKEKVKEKARKGSGGKEKTREKARTGSGGKGEVKGKAPKIMDLDEIRNKYSK